ncbi:MAG: methyltransferase domain-containing protein [Pseudomonadota bacterium]
MPEARLPHDVMEFTGKSAALQRRMAESRDLAQRRLAILHQHAPPRGERKREIGCGAGLLLREIGLATGPHGLAAGIDISPDQTAAAEAECDGVPGVQARTGDVLALDWPDAVFDGAVAAHVIEYLDAPEQALAAIRRVLKPGARFVCLAVNWDSEFWYGPDPALTAPVVAAWRAGLPRPNLPAQLGPMLARTGFGALRQVPVPVVNASLSEDQLAPWMARLMAATAGPAAGPAWLKALEAADAAGEMFHSSVPILTSATAI